MVEILLQQNVNVILYGKCGTTVSILTASRGHDELVEMLLRANAHKAIT